MLSAVGEEQLPALQEFMARTPVEIFQADSDLSFDIDLTLEKGADRVRIRITNHHTNIIYL